MINLDEDFSELSKEDQITYVIEHLRDLPDELVDLSIDLLVGAGETEYAIALAKDTGRTEKAIEIALEEGDYLWAALIANKAGMEQEATRLYRDGLEYYISMDMYGRAVSVAKALGLPQNEIDLLFQAGIRAESRNMDTVRVRAALESIAFSLEGALAGRDDETAKEIRSAMKEEMENIERRSLEQ